MESLDALASRVRTADVVDAVRRMHQHRCHINELVSPTPVRGLFGPAVIISYLPACQVARPPERYNFKRRFHQAIERGAGGRVLVLASNGYSEASLGGGAKLSRAQNPSAGRHSRRRAAARLRRAATLRPGHLLPW